MTQAREDGGEIAVCLWFDGEAEAAVAHYLGIFEDGRVTKVHRPRADAPALTVAFELRGRPFLALNGGPHYKFTPAVSLVVDCADQAEIDHFWARLSEGGQKNRCGWLADKFGLSWQIVPRDLPALLSRGPAVMQALMKMDRLDIAALRRAGEI
jgi:predicted 3-demethylubiquinone-9 3-methyltransferase (glyoxalase superfamily)